MTNFFSRGGLTLDRLHTLLAVSEAGGITAAAPGKPSLQSQMSRQIAELEEFFERQLVERRGKGIALTADGQQLAMIVRDSFTALRDFGATPVVAPLDVLVGAGDSVIRWWLIPQGAAFDPARVQVSALSGEEIVAGLLDAKLDFGVVRASELNSGLSSCVLGNVDYALYVPAALLPEGKHHRVKDLVQRLPIGVLNGEPSFSARLEGARACGRATHAQLHLRDVSTSPRRRRGRPMRRGVADAGTRRAPALGISRVSESDPRQARRPHVPGVDAAPRAAAPARRGAHPADRRGSAAALAGP
jgi:DNA-binding transcriptional LysR family regulator